MPALDTGALSALALAHDISYAKSSVLAEHREVTWVRREPYVQGSTVELPVDLDATPSDLTRLATVLHCGAGLLRWEPGYGYRAHRGFPSPRAVYATEVFCVAPELPGLAEGIYHYQATQHRLVRAHGEGGRADAADALSVDLQEDAVAFIVATDFSRITPKYGDFGYSLCALEAGHALANLAHVADLAGCRSSALYRFDDDRLRALLGPQALQLSPFAALVLHTRGGLRRPLSGRGGQQTTAPRTELAAVPWGMRITDVERAIGREAGRPAEPLHVPPPEGSPARGRVSRRMREILQERNSGWGGSGGELNPHPVSIPVATFTDVLQRSSVRYAANDLGAAPPEVGCYAAAIRIGGLDVGTYQFDRRDGRLRQITVGDVRGALQRAYAYPPEWGNLHALAGAIVFTVDYEASVRRWGARGVRIAYMLCGALAQEMCLAANRLGHFARPIRAFFDDQLEALFGLSGTGQSAVYTLLLGTNRHATVRFNVGL